VVALVVAGLTLSAFAQSTTLTILTINDVYEIAPVRGKGGLAELMTLLKAERATASHHLTTVNGDFLSPSLMSGLFKGAQMIDLFNSLGVDVVTFGNHEFDFGPAITKQRIAESKFPWLGTNVWGPDNQPFGGAVATLTRAVGSLKIGLLGVITPETATLSSPGPDVQFTPAILTARAAVDTLKKEGVDVIIALTHLTIAEDRELAKQVPEIRVILGGHDHDPITWYEGDTFIHKSGYDAHYLGRIDLRIDKQMTDKDPKVTVLPSWRMIANSGVTPDPEVAAKVAQYTAKLDAELAQPVGKSVTALDSRRNEVRSKETTMGNLIADAIRDAVKADAGITNGGGIRGDRLYEAGTTLTRKDILQELPFGNVTVLLEVSGAELLAALENGVSQVEAKAGRFPQVSGINFVYDPKKPAGSRVVEAKINGKPVDPVARYRLATNDYLYKGGDGYASLTKGKAIIDASGGTLMATIVMNYIAAKGTVAPQVEGRIVTAP
jgi:2',3'-cyclic-nucleotide 2'-phosphodiesterase (5'-nucleotidase family)